MKFSLFLRMLGMRAILCSSVIYRATPAIVKVRMNELLSGRCRRCTAQGKIALVQESDSPATTEGGRNAN